MQDQTKAYLYAAVTVLFWSTVATAFKLSLRHVSADALVFYSSLVSVVVLLCITLATGRLRQLRRWTSADIRTSLSLGFLNPFLYYLVLFRAYDLLPAQEALTLNFAWPVVLALFSILLLRQPISARALLAMAVSFAGVVLIATRGDPLGLDLANPLGVALALGSTVIWALYWIYGVKDSRDPVTRLLVNFGFGCVLSGGYLWLSGSLEVPGTAGLIGAVYIGIFEMGIAFVAWLRALKLSRTTAQVGQLIYLTPFLSLLVIGLVVGEPIYASTVAGLALIIGGIVLQRRAG
ncbi:MAG: DMT family transporter [Deltaproteobacteria bacterium]|nr:DMT family transporter [Deltaproteobacteria bacterium]